MVIPSPTSKICFKTPGNQHAPLKPTPFSSHRLQGHVSHTLWLRPKLLPAVADGARSGAGRQVRHVRRGEVQCRTAADGVHCTARVAAHRHGGKRRRHRGRGGSRPRLWPQQQPPTELRLQAVAVSERPRFHLTGGIRDKWWAESVKTWWAKKSSISLHHSKTKLKQNTNTLIWKVQLQAAFLEHSAAQRLLVHPGVGPRPTASHEVLRRGVQVVAGGVETLLYQHLTVGQSWAPPKRRSELINMVNNQKYRKWRVVVDWFSATWYDVPKDPKASETFRCSFAGYECGHICLTPQRVCVNPNVHWNRALASRWQLFFSPISSHHYGHL